MLFSSIPFLYYFLPAVILSYFLISWTVEALFRAGGKAAFGKKAGLFTKNLILLAFSLVFYAWGEPIYVFLMIGSILMFWGCGLAIGKAKTRAWKRVWLWVSVVTSVGLLGIFKYADFFVENFNAITGLSTPLLRLALPVGISFYTFQSMSYTIDVYRGGAQVQKNPVNFGAYVSLFPQLIAGPIVRYVDVAKELDGRTHNWNDIALGLRRFVIGLAKKIIIADNFALLMRLFRDSGDQSVVFYWMYAIAFSLNIYFDFSGYSDMAIGLGRVFGFHFIENFNHPYMSKSVAEFWRRWHMSLGSWFRDYVYIPLGGNRVGKGRWLFNTLVVWMLTGFWHGASWNFILWGLLYAVCLLIEKWVPALKKLPAFFGHFYTMLVVVLGFVLFNATDLSQAAADFAGMFGFAGLPFMSSATAYYLGSFALLFVLGIVGSTSLVRNAANRLADGKKTGNVIAVLEPLVLVFLLLVCTGYLVDGAFSPFLYFRF